MEYMKIFLYYQQLEATKPHHMQVQVSCASLTVYTPPITVLRILVIIFSYVKLTKLQAMHQVCCIEQEMTYYMMIKKIMKRIHCS